MPAKAFLSKIIIPPVDISVYHYILQVLSHSLLHLQVWYSYPTGSKPGDKLQPHLLSR